MTELEQLGMDMMHRQSGGSLQTQAGHKTAFPQLPSLVVQVSSITPFCKRKRKETTISRRLIFLLVVASTVSFLLSETYLLLPILHVMPSVSTPNQGQDTGNVLFIASVPYDKRHVAALWSQLECFTAGINKVIISAPEGSEAVVELILAAARKRLLLDITAHYYKNDRYDVGLWCDALIKEGYLLDGNANSPVPRTPFENTILSNDSVFAIRHFNGILEELQDTHKHFVGLSYSNTGGFWLESVVRGFSRKGIFTFMHHSCLPADHPSFGQNLKSRVRRKRRIVEHHEIKLASQYLPNETIGLYSSDEPQNWATRQNKTWVQNENLWRFLKDEQRFPVAKVNQPYAVKLLKDPLILTCTSKMDKDFLESLNFSSPQHMSSLSLKLLKTDKNESSMQ